MRMQVGVCAPPRSQRGFNPRKGSETKNHYYLRENLCAGQRGFNPRKGSETFQPGQLLA